MIFSLCVFLILAVGVFISLAHLRLDVGVPRDILVFIWRVAVGAGALWLGYNYLRWRTTIITLTSDHITKQAGIITKTYGRIEISRISNYIGKRGVLDQLLGLMDLYIDTPGGEGDSEIRVRFLDVKETLAFLERVRQIRSGAKAPVAAPA